MSIEVCSFLVFRDISKNRCSRSYRHNGIQESRDGNSSGEFWQVLYDDLSIAFFVGVMSLEAGGLATNGGVCMMALIAGKYRPNAFVRL